MTSLLLLLIPLAFVIYTVYKGLNPSLSMMLGALIVCVVSGLNPMTAILGDQFNPGTFVQGIQSAAAMFFFVFITANLFAQVILKTGAAKSIANALTGVIVGKSTGFAAKMKALYAFMAVAIVFGFGGLDAFVCVFTLLPIGMMMFEKYDVPRRLLPATLFAGVTTAVCCPGTPLTCGNILASMFLGTKTTAAFVPGLVGVAVILICDCVYLWSAVKKAEKNGEHFTWGKVNLPPMGNDEKLPNPVIAVLPLLLVAIMNMVFGISVVVSLLAGTLLAAVIMCNFIAADDAKVKPFLEVADRGIMAASMAFIPMAIQMALATLIQATSGFGFLSNVFTDMATSINPLIAWATSATFSGFLAGNSIAGLQLSAGIFGPIANDIGLSMSAAHRVGCFAISILDTIPINAAVISGLMTCGLTHKEGYWPIFRTTVLYIFFGMVAVIAMCLLFPGLAV